jgi:Predicted membrane protein involved in D-alanine export
LLFTEPTFLFLFLPLLLLLYFIRGSREHAAYGNWLLLAASVIFYAKGGGAFTWLMLGSIAFNYWMAIAVDRAHGTPSAARRLAFAVTVNLVVLGVFKYANFFADNVNALLGTCTPRRLPSAGAAADRHLVLHLPRHLVRH